MAPACDIAAAANAIEAASHLIAGNDAIAAVEINPPRAHASGAVALDALLLTR